MAALVIIFMMVFVLPTFANMFKNMGAELPLPTKIVIWLSDMTRKYIIFILLGIGAAIYAIKRYYQTDQGSLAIDTFLLKVPVVGHADPQGRGGALHAHARHADLLRACRSWKACSSPPAPPATASSRRRSCRPASSVTAGGTLAEPLKTTPVFPAMVVHMISVGENTGALDAMLNKIADFYDDEVDAAVGGAHLAARADDDRVPRRVGRWDRHRHVPADLQDGDADQVAGRVSPGE